MPTKPTTITAAPRAAIYARVSTTGHGQDVGLQLDELRAVAQQRGWQVVAVSLPPSAVSSSTSS